MWISWHFYRSALHVDFVAFLSVSLACGFCGISIGQPCMWFRGISIGQPCMWISWHFYRSALHVISWHFYWSALHVDFVAFLSVSLACDFVAFLSVSHSPDCKLLVAWGPVCPIHPYKASAHNSNGTKTCMGYTCWIDEWTDEWPQKTTTEDD